MKITDLTTGQIIAIGAAIVLGLPICVGLVVGHFLGFWPGVASGVLVLLFVAFMAHKQIVKQAQQQEKQLDTKDKDSKV